MKEVVIMARFTSIIKEGSIIIMQTDEKEQPFKFDCAERKLYSFTGRQVSTVNPILRNCAKNSNHGVSMLINALLDYMNSHYYESMRKMEMFIPYLDIINTCDICQVPDTLPKGYIKWVKENNAGINKTTLEQFLVEQEIKKMPKAIAEIYNIIAEEYGGGHYVLNSFLRMKHEDKEIFCKIFKTSMKSFNWNFSKDMENFIRYILDASSSRYSEFPVEWKDYIDTNRNFAYNKAIIQEIKNKIRNEKILSWESKFSAIETLSNDTYTIIVPKTMEEFTDEGKQQHNCVGYYYHNAMAENTQIIYFIRKTSNLNKSYITNRYSIRATGTVETRMINNITNTDTISLDLITRIDKMITDILETL